MEPIRDPRMYTLSWEGWTFLRKGPWPEDATVCVLRIRENSGGLVPRESIRETQAVYHAETGWEDWLGRHLGFAGGILAWRPLGPEEYAWSR